MTKLLEIWLQVIITIWEGGHEASVPDRLEGCHRGFRAQSWATGMFTTQHGAPGSPSAAVLLWAHPVDKTALISKPLLSEIHPKPLNQTSRARESHIPDASDTNTLAPSKLRFPQKHHVPRKFKTL